MSAGKSLILPAEINNPPHRRERREVAFEIERAHRISGKADVGDADLVAMAITPGLLGSSEIGFERLECRFVPMVSPFLHTGLIDLVFVCEKFTDTRHDQGVSVASDDLRQRTHASASLRLLRQQRRIWMRLVEIFEDGKRFKEHVAVVFDE